MSWLAENLLASQDGICSVKFYTEKQKADVVFFRIRVMQHTVTISNLYRLV